jgi:hypothetical protein
MARKARQAASPRLIMAGLARDRSAQATRLDTLAGWFSARSLAHEGVGGCSPWGCGRARLGAWMT